MLRRLLFWGLVIGFGWVIVAHLTEIEKLGRTLRQGNLAWVMAAIALQIVHQVFFAAIYQGSFTTVAVPSRLRNLIPLVFVSQFVNVTAPTGGAAGVAIFVDDAVQRGESGTRAAVGLILVGIIDFAVFSLILLVALINLFMRHNLQIYEIITSLVLFAFVLLMTGLLMVSLWRPEQMVPLLRRVARTVNWLGNLFRYPQLLGDDWVSHHANEFTVASKSILQNPGGLWRTSLITLASHLASILSLYALFAAFHQRVPPSIVVIGFSMTILFSVVSPFQGGVGIVEGLLPVIYTSLGVPTATATVVSLAFRGLTFWIPLLIGFVLLQRLRIFAPQRSELITVSHVRLIAILTGMMGVLNILSATVPALRDRTLLLSEYSPLEVRYGGRLTVVLAGFALLLLAQGLARHKQTAWWVALIMLLISAVSHLVKGLDYEEASVALLLVGYLIWQRRQFRAHADQPTVMQGLRVVVAALAFTLLYGTIGFYLLDRHFHVRFGLGMALRQTLVMFAQFYDPGLQPITGFGRYFADSIYLVGAITLGYGLWALLRPVVLRAPASSAERERASKLIEGYGSSGLARFLLFPDKSYYFSPGGSLIGYAARGGVAVALGDPIGPEEDVYAAIVGFRGFCEGHGWECAFYQSSPQFLPHYQHAGYEATRIGHDAIVDLHEFKLEGKDGKPLRNAVNRLARAGYRAEVKTPLHSDDILLHLRAVSDEWLMTMQNAEMRFSLGWFDKEYLRNSVVVVVYNAEEHLVAFANLVQEYHHNGVTLDLMRRRSNLENGAMEFLFVTLLLWCKEQGYDSVNLGLSALSGVGDHPTDPILEKAMRYVYARLTLFYNFKGLHAFKEKFNPHWEPRYLVYPNPASLPGVLTSLARVSSGDDFVVSYLSELPTMLRAMGQRIRDRFTSASSPPTSAQSD